MQSMNQNALQVSDSQNIDYQEAQPINSIGLQSLKKKKVAAPAF